MKKIFVLFLMIFFLLPLFAANSESKFAIIGVKSEPAAENSKMIRITVFFNGPADSAGIYQDKIFVNDRPLRTGKILFAKRGRSFIFYIPDEKKEFTLRFENLKNSAGHLINPIRLGEFTDNTFWKFSRETGKWQKF